MKQNTCVECGGTHGHHFTGCPETPDEPELVYTLETVPPGLFWFNGELGLKTEYEDPNGSEAYCVSSGEYFWGGTSDAKSRQNLVVEPAASDVIKTSNWLVKENMYALHEVCRLRCELRNLANGGRLTEWGKRQAGISPNKVIGTGCA